MAVRKHRKLLVHTTDFAVQIAEDFTVLYEASADKLASVWPVLYIKLRDKIRSLKLKDKHLLNMLSLIQDNVENRNTPGTCLQLCRYWKVIVAMQKPCYCILLIYSLEETRITFRCLLFSVTGIFLYLNVICTQTV